MSEQHSTPGHPYYVGPPAPEPEYDKQGWAKAAYETKKGRRIIMFMVPVATFLFGICLGNLGGGDDKTALALPAPTATETVSTVITVAPTPLATAPATKAPKPTATPKPKPTIDDGKVVVGDDIPAGTYEVRGATEDCYYAITKHASSSYVDSSYGTGGHLTVVLKKGWDFETEDCGTWTQK